MDTLNPLFFSKVPIEAAVIPLPKEETTPPVIKTYLVMLFTCPFLFNVNNLSKIAGLRPTPRRGRVP
jgi:hypothetical protein